MDILDSKLVAPYLGNLLPRSRLARQFNCLSGKRLVLITAGAGYGKTTLAAQALSGACSKNQKQALVWYRLDRFDRDIATFAGYLLRGLDKVFPGIEERFAQRLCDADLAGNFESLSLRCVKVLESEPNQPIFIVLDDYHLLGPAVQDPLDAPGFVNVHAFLDCVLERLPGHVCFVLISRTDPPLSLSTLRVRRQVLDINESDLVFTPDEASALFGRVHNQVPEEKILSALYEQTGGWAAGLVLFGAALEKNGTSLAGTGAMDTGKSRAHTFKFLEENLFETQSPDMQQFMIKTALMDPMETAVCNRVLGIEDARQRFRQMMAAHLMVFPANPDETAFNYHHLFRDFLLEKLHHTLGASKIRQIQLDIAGCLEAGSNYMALVHYVDAGAYEDAARFMQTFELEFLVQGKISFVRTCLEKIPEAVIAKNPHLLFMAAKQYSYFGFPDKSIACLTAACRILRQTNSWAYVAKCLIDLGAQYYYTGHIPEARRLMVQVLDDARAEPGTYILAVMYLSFFCAVLGEIDQAVQYESQVRDDIESYPELERTAALAAMDLSKTYILYIKGDFEVSKEINLDLIHRCELAGLDAYLPLLCYHGAATDCMLGLYDTGLGFAQKGIRAAEKIHLRDSQSGWLYISLADNYLGLGQHDTAQTHAATALDIFRRPGNRWGMANALDLMARISLAAGRVNHARSRVARALEMIKGYGLLMSESIIVITLARILIASERHEQALDCLARTRKFVKPACYYLCASWLLDACCCHVLGREEQAASHFQKGLAVAKKKNFDRLVLTDAQPLISAMAGRLKKTVFSAYLESLGLLPGPARQGLEIRMLGRFGVLVDGREIEHTQWPGSQPLILFQYLAVHQSKGFIPKDVLVEMLWPDQDPEKTGKRFNTAMSRLRKLLEPNLSPRAPSAYIQRKKDQYALFPGIEGYLDIADFQTQANHALKMAHKDPRAAFECGKKAEHLYTGPFLGDTMPYLEWCFRQRDRLRMLYCKLCHMLTNISRDLKDPDAGILYAQNMLKEDPFDESMYRQLIRFFLETGQSQLARRTSNTCREKMKEIDCPLHLTTLELMKKAAQ